MKAASARGAWMATPPPSIPASNPNESNFPDSVMARLLKQILAFTAAIGLAVAAARGAVEISDLNVTNVGTTTFTVVWTTSEVSTPGLEVYTDSAGTNAVGASLALDYYPIGEGDPGVVNSAAGRTSRRELEVLAISKRVISVQVAGLAPGTTYFVRPRTFSSSGVDNGSGLLPLRQVTTALFTSMVVDARLLRVRFSGLASPGMIALVQGPAGTAPLSALVGDGTATDMAVLPLAALLDAASNTNALLDAPQQLSIRLLGAGAPAGAFTPTINYGTAFTVAKLDTIDVGTTNPAPAFTTPPANQTEQVGNTATFAAVATGTPTPTLKWQRQPAGGAWADLTEGATYVGVATASLQVRTLTLAMNGDQFRCIATNGVPPDATSVPATLTVTPGPAAPTIATHPVSTGVNAGGNVTLTVVASGVPAPSYQWKKGTSPVSGATTASLALTNLTLGDAGSYTVEVANTVSMITSNPAIVTVYVAPAITTPPATQTVVAGQSVTFSVVATGTPDPRYQWKKDGANLLGATAATLVLNALTVADSGSFVVEVSNTAAGGLGGTATSQAATLTVTPLPPVFVSTPGPTATAIQGLNFLYGPVTINATTAVFTATGLPPGLIVNPASGNISGSPAVVGSLPASFTVVLKAENSSGSDTRTITLTVNPTPPLITSPAAASGQVGLAFTYAITASNSPTSYGASGLPGGLTVNGTTGVITGTPTQAGTFAATISATNAGGTSSQALSLTITPAPSAPVFSGNASPGGTQGVFFTYAPTFSGSPTAYALSAGTLPAGLTLNTASGVISGTPTQIGTFNVTLQATNAGGPTDAPLQITINPAPAAPEITSANAVATTVGAAFSFTLTASGTPAVYTFIANDRPAWLNLNAATGVLSGTPVLGTFTLRVSATNSPSAGVTLQGPEAILTITVGPSPNAPVINSAAVVPGRVGVPLNYLLTANPAANSFALTSSAPPAWLDLTNLTSGVVTGTPTAAGPVRVVFAATSALYGQGLGLEVLFDIAPAQLAPVITSSGTAQGQVRQPFLYATIATNGPITGYAMSGTLPAGLSFNPTTGVIDGIPTAATTTPVVVSLTASNAAGASEAKNLEIVILSPPAAPVITSSLEANGRVGSVFSYQITASGNATSFVATDLPAGLTLNPGSGLISGSPTTAGRFSISLQAANAQGLGAPATLELTVVSATGAPRVTSLPAASGQVGSIFRYTILAEPGPILNYNVNGTLPLGLSLNTSTGVIAGTPSRSGLTIVRVTATNSTGTSLPQPLVFNIRPSTGVPVITSPKYDLATVGEAFSHTITATNMPGSRPFTPPNSLDAVNLPPGLAVNPSMGVIEGTPTTVGIYTVSLVGTNSSGVGATRDLTIVVRPSAQAPEITSVQTAAGRAGSEFSYTITATHNPTSFEVLDAPAWMTVGSQSGVIAGIPTSPGVIAVRIRARNSAGSSEAETLEITIAPAVGTPVITSSRTAEGQKGSAFTYVITASPAATSFIATGLPSGLSLNGATGIISGTPTSSGRFAVTLTVANGSGQGAQAILMLEIKSALRLSPGS